MAILSTQVQNNTSGGGIPQTSRARSYRSGNSVLSLREGQTLKGVVSDVHGNKITLSMEDGSSFTGELSEANKYSIGQKAAFMITDLDDSRITMKAMGDSYLLGMDDTIEQALEEAGLPKTARNLDIVNSLLENGKSISKESIMASIKLTSGYPDASVDAVITMDRLNMPMTRESVKQFQNYKEQTHQLMDKMDTLTDGIAQMMKQIGDKVPRLAAQVGDALLELALQSDLSADEVALLHEKNLPAQPEIPTYYDAEGNPLTSESLAEMAWGEESVVYDADGNTLSASQALRNLNAALVDAAAKPLSDDETQIERPVTELTDEEASFVTSDAESKDIEHEAGENALGRMKQIFSGLADTAAGAIKNAVAQSGITEDFRTPFIHEQAGFTLSPEERVSFSEFLKDYPVSDELRNGIADGTITDREFLTEIQKAFPKMSEEQAGKLLASKDFEGLVKSQMMSNWSLSPGELKDSHAIERIYERMSEQFDEISKFSEQVLGKNVFTHVSDAATDMNQNLDFMRQLNEAYQYIQLPLKLQNQNAHGDLYVMTRKESLKKDPSHLKAVLHLELDHLGTLDIHVTRENTAVTANFYVDNEPAMHLLDRNMEMLQDAINEQGFAFTSTTQKKEKDIDIVNDFISAEAPIGDMKRYNFDLRA